MDLTADVGAGAGAGGAGAGAGAGAAFFFAGVAAGAGAGAGAGAAGAAGAGAAGAAAAAAAAAAFFSCHSRNVLTESLPLLAAGKQLLPGPHLSSARVPSCSSSAFSKPSLHFLFNNLYIVNSKFTATNNIIKLTNNFTKFIIYIYQ